jgi:D-alanyl-D-alanine carboxypeptidase
MKSFVNSLILALVVFSLTSNVTFASSSRHALLVYDANNNEVLYQEHGNDIRYPASLTKMMTLYLLFDSLRAGKINFNTRMVASQYAASQPQTNVSIRRGDSITVAQAIDALIIRSANDIAVVVAERLGGTTANFATMMTNKARALGMKNTVFKNPSGLPDARQHTTAMDMALLGEALRDHFPQYYHYFKKQSFTYKGVNYRGHNRVLDKLPGVDGIKTGYINASGFNLVSSLKRGNINIVAVILGGTTAGERDAKMVGLLNKTYTRLVAAENEKQINIANAATQSLPKPVLAAATPAVDKKIIVRDVVVPAPIKPIAPSIDVHFSEKASPQPANRIAVSLNSPAAPKKNTLDYQLASYSDAYPVPAQVALASKPYTESGWAVQIGVFSDKHSASNALSAVASKIRPQLANAVADVEYAQQENRAFHRARFKNLARQEANTVCQKLQQLHQDCFVTKVN